MKSVIWILDKLFQRVSIHSPTRVKVVLLDTLFLPWLKLARCLLSFDYLTIETSVINIGLKLQRILLTLSAFLQSKLQEGKSAAAWLLPRWRRSQSTQSPRPGSPLQAGTWCNSQHGCTSRGRPGHTGWWRTLCSSFPWWSSWQRRRQWTCQRKCEAHWSGGQ